MLNFPHRRFNPLTGEYVLVSPHRAGRPWLGQVEKSPSDQRAAYDPDCYLCPGNQRASDARNPLYTETFVFTNDFAALLQQASEMPKTSQPLLKVESEPGNCRVICFSPRHDLTLAEMPTHAIRTVVDVWVTQTSELGQQYRWVQIFENKGEMMGSSNPHPHGQVWAGSALPNEPAKEDRQQHAYFEERHSVLLVDYARLESDQRERIVVENDRWMVVVPFWALWPFETLLLPRRQVLRLPDLTGEDRDSLAQILKHLLTKYDNLFESSFPYSMGWHGAPFDPGDQPHWQLHAHFYPPLLRSAVVRKFMVGYELLAEAQRDLTAEQAADRLRALSEIHYKKSAV
ncbi:MAG TPA: UDP-glucose--hexose-1-phosphate uridylyltransferase [Anaerolineae bacterium]|jgi:UDPglucose--hexose-1-phosphate uridylyltransferase|nr:UDP-glucose--hexose-1-phosphate uridylyltransferase [Anaerolineae bacterium]